MDSNQHNQIWERRQAELWERIFQVTQDVVTLADSLDSTAGEAVLRAELVGSAMAVGKHLVRATAADNETGFQESVQEARLQAIETDYWLRLAYVVQQKEHVQQDLSSVISQYSGIIDLLEKTMRHVQEKHDAGKHLHRPRVNL